MGAKAPQREPVEDAALAHTVPGPIWFGESAKPLYGWFHPATGSRPLDGVVVFCNPFGYDAFSAHYPYKTFAEHLAGIGISALRFDYAGTGNSWGDEEGPDRVGLWLSSLRTAVTEAKRLSGASKVFLFGARFGALLASVFAQEEPVDGLVLLGPPRSGAVYIRELQAVNKIRVAKPGEAASPDIVYSEDESIGHPLPADVRAAISELDPRKVEKKPAPRALVIARDDLPGPEERLVTAFRDLGVVVEHSHAPGYTGLFADSSVLPAETEELIINWMREHPLGPLGDSALMSGASNDGEPQGTLASATFDGLTEECVRFGRLFGVYCEPAADSGVKVRDTGVLFLTGGSNHHIGMQRMHVRQARALAKLGFRTLRFDLSGIGESPPLPGSRDRWIYVPTTIPETQTGLDYMMTRGCKKLALTGVCSGGYSAFHTAIVDDRVSAILTSNVPIWHFNPGDSGVLAKSRPEVLPWALPKAQMPEVTRFSTKEIAMSTAVMPPHMRYVKAQTLPPRSHTLLEDPDDIACGFGQLLARGCRVMIVYGTGDPGRQALDSHLGPNLRKASGRIGLALIGGCDHTFTPRVAQKRLLDVMVDYFSRVLS